MNTIDQEALEGIYTFSFYVNDEEDDPRYPTITMGYNTYTHLQQVKIHQ